MGSETFKKFKERAIKQQAIYHDYAKDQNKNVDKVI